MVRRVRSAVSDTPETPAPCPADGIRPVRQRPATRSPTARRRLSSLAWRLQTLRTRECSWILWTRGPWSSCPRLRMAFLEASFKRPAKLAKRFLARAVLATKPHLGNCTISPRGFTEATKARMAACSSRIGSLPSRRSPRARCPTHWKLISSISALGVTFLKTCTVLRILRNRRTMSSVVANEHPAKMPCKETTA
eukprot:9503081-Pyramimonas_sp.AAC.2